VRLIAVLSCLLFAGSVFAQQTQPAPDSHEAQSSAPLTPMGLAKMVPADTAVFLCVTGAANWEKRFPGHPLASTLVRILPGHSRSGIWRRLRYAMGMSQQELVQRYMGKAACLVASHAGEGASLVLLLRVDPPDSQKLVDNMQLVEHHADDLNGFRFYITPDDGVSVAISDQWIFLSASIQTEYLQHIVSQMPIGASLANTIEFRQAYAKVSGEPLAFAYVQPDVSQTHVAWLNMDDRGVVASYRGRSPQLSQWIRRANRPPGDPMATLPRTAMAAVTFHLESVDANQAHPVDRYIAPHKLHGDILRRIQSPVTIFVNAEEVPEMMRPGQRPEMPSLGIMFRMSDPSLADDLDVIFTNLANATALTEEERPPYTEKVEPIQVRAVKHETGIYRTANIGPSLAARGQEDALRSIELTWGRVRDKYLICTREIDYRACATQSVEVEGNKPEQATDGQAQRVIAAVSIRTAPMVSYIRRWVAYEQLRHMARSDRHFGGGGDIGWRRIRTLENVADSFEHFGGAHLQIHVAEDEFIHGNMHLIARERSR